MPNGPTFIRALTPAEERANRIREATGLWNYRDPLPKPGPPIIRASTPLERLNGWILSIYEAAAAQPLGRVTDALGLTDLAGMVRSAQEPPVWQYAASPEPKPGGLFSRVGRVAAQVPVKGAHPNKVASLLKSGASAEEVAYRKVPEFLAGKGNAPVTRAELEAHLAAHPAPVPEVKTLGGAAWSPELERAWSNNEFGPGQGARPATPDDWVTASRRLERVAQQWQRNGDPRQADRYFRLSEEAMSMAEGVEHATGSTGRMPKWTDPRYNLPGGEKYSETLLTLPERRASTGPAAYEIRPAANGRGYVFTDTRTGEVAGASNTLELTESQAREWAAANPPPTRNTFAEPTGFKSHAFPDPNIVVWTRQNERMLPTGERGRFLEEVQSDWHQRALAQVQAIFKGIRTRMGLSKETPSATVLSHATPEERAVIDSGGYQGMGEAYTAFYRTAKGDKVPLGHGATADAARASIQPGWDTIPGVKIEVEARPVKVNEFGVPDAPFKESWPDLALKQQLLEAVRDPNTQWLGFTSGQTQAARYDLSKQISKIEYKPKSGPRLGYVQAYDHDGKLVLDKIAEPAELPDLIGKEVTDKILSAEPRFDDRGRAIHALEGLDLQVGGEGMRKFYDALLPKRLEKIVKPFGGTVERAPLSGSGRTRDAITAEIKALNSEAGEGRITIDEYNQRLGHLQAERSTAMSGDEGWIVRLTPAMKARLLKEGLPLMTIPLAALAGRPMPSHPQPEAR